ncbi:hypothetical protein H310_01189 [Aphanomyces invadans]|uniref:Uncharacterized protein n=1 Tax=Aphanomyces invadans TaxID=157072 RepID=A0A024UQD2_9STRA|nr:hypothetical protein H310_01189 [Aphanomyces invadans]ETW08656.1 hypothetical protein H310_01189 [Aphanomyces invadans]|eukprot:XP_008862461.1 hypothetical protein H310_01189 [Aphanomyces invadans]
MTLPPVQTDVVHLPQRHIVSLRVDCQSMAPPPMLVHTTHGSQSLYSVIRVLMASPSAADGVRELRRYVYHKRVGDMAVVDVPNKRTWSERGYEPSSHEACIMLTLTRGSPFRYDVVASDGSCQMELSVPSHVDAMVDCYHVQRVGVFLHKSQLFPWPERALTSPRPLVHIHLTFFNLAADRVVCRLHGTGLLVEEEASVPPSTVVVRPSTAHTAIEMLQVFTASVDAVSLASTPSDLRSALARPGVVCLHACAPRTPRIMHTVALHGGTASLTSKSSLVVPWVPGVLEYALTPQTATRRALKGALTLTFHPTNGTRLRLYVGHVTASMGMRVGP